jgi:uracil-DNA glycosylase family 4
MQQGFFFKEEPKQVKKKPNRQQSTCPCGLEKTCRSPKIPVYGKGQKGILIVGEASGEIEDEYGIPFCHPKGKSANFLYKNLKNLGIDMDKDCWRTNAILCRPPNNRKLTNREINICRLNLLRNIKELKPQKIITLGAVALQGLIGHRTSVTGVEKWVGQNIPDQELGCYIHPTYHPAYLLRNEDDKILHKQFKRHLKDAIDLSFHFTDYSDIKDKITIYKNPAEVIIFLQGLLPGSVIAIDIETTGIKPHAPGHEIICMAITIDSNKTIAFPFFDDKEFKLNLKRILRNPKIYKIAHNIKFEDSWLRHFLKTNIEGWGWDTMLASHVLDNRGGTKGLKFQAYVNYGILGYDKEIESHIKSKEKDANSFNRIKECNLDKLLLYCGIDSLLSYRLYIDTAFSSVRNHDKKGFDLFLEGIKELSRIEANGIRVNRNYYERKINHITKKMELLDNKILNSKEVQQWKGDFNHSSSKQLRELLFDILKVNSVKQTVKGNNSVDIEALENIDLSFVKNILKWRKLKKIKDTYLKGFLREQVEDYLHPSFNLHTVSTYRSSSNNPNFQNIPKRDEEAQQITRAGIIPRPGRQLMEVDYSKIEVCISACYHKDPNMIKEVEDPKTDMHRDTAMELFCIEQPENVENLRYIAKNGFVFPQFYGSYYVDCAKNIWKEIDDSVKEHLKKYAIKNYSQFEKHLQKIEDKFWNKRFRVYQQWKKDIWRDYQQTGYIKTLSGFTCRARMNFKEATNYPIQGSAFHCLLWSLIQINKFLRENNFQTCIVGQIHDSIVFDLVPEEKEELKTVIRKIMTEDIREHWPWIIVPLDIDAEISEIDGNWSMMEKEEI